MNTSQPIQAIMILFVAFMFVSCNESSFDNINSRNTAIKALKNEPTMVNNEQAKWKRQLNKMLTVGNKKLEDTPLQMIDYKLAGKIRSSNDIQAIIKKMLSDNQYLPKYPSDSLSYYTPENFGSFSLIKIGQVRSLYKAKEYHLEGLRNYLDSTLGKGQKLIKIHWKYKGNPITTIAIVDDKKGILYDNIIVNTLIIKTTHTTTVNGKVVKKDKRAVQGNKSDRDLTTITITTYIVTNGISDNIRAYWLFGTQRGRAFGNFHVKGRIVTKTKKGNPPHIISRFLLGADVYAFARITLGNSAARKKLFRFRQGYNGIARGAYAIVLASPTISISIDITGTGFHITLLGFGSSGKASRSKVYTAQGLHM